ncbi:hypothetical protein [Xanthomonas campestris]|uniref:hypothetical protein n=1 Tax=Xanthomonas campestris TaxID=339 RepID=UPI001E2B2752|nr:hypothetical protein [Xanthomonas campestris]MCC5070498.1 hypothetical protein [Xanthomonas campestris pv. plantaginis]
MKNKTTKTPAGHDDVSGLFARLGGQASEGYHDFAYTQLAPRAAAGNSTASDGDATKAAAPAATVAQAAIPAPAPAIAQTPVMPVAPAALSAVPAVMAPEAPHADADAVAPLRKLRQPDAPAVRAVPAEPVQAGTPLQQLFERLLQTDAPAATHSSPLKRLRSR